ncbi:MAG: SH3 domain-containing protein [Candidatus Dormibacteria bacterium]
MAADDIKSAITGWCTTEDSLQFVEDLAEAGTDVSLTLRAGSAVHGTVPVKVVQQSGADRLTISSAAQSSDAAALEGRPALVRSNGSDIEGVVYLDGFNRNSFMAVVAEVAKTARLLGSPASAGASWSERPAQTVPGGGDAWAPQPAATLPGGGDVPAATPSAGTLPTPSFGGPSPSYGAASPAAAYTPPSGQAAAPTQPAPQPVFAPTHTVPPQGMQAWAAPDPNGAVVATLGGGLPIQVTEVRGAWARILCSNGWQGWVDGRIIGVAR